MQDDHRICAVHFGLHNDIGVAGHLRALEKSDLLQFPALGE
jgi:hypothetical protein